MRNLIIYGVILGSLTVGVTSGINYILYLIYEPDRAWTKKVEVGDESNA